LTQENAHKYDPRNHACPSIIALTLLMKALGLSLKSDRGYFHNVFLVAACANLPISYSFGWYGDGQYSTSLANDLAQVEHLEYCGGCPELSLKKHIQEKINAFLPALDSPGPFVDQKSWVNLLAVALWGIDHNDRQEQQTILSILIEPHVRNKKSLIYLDKALETIEKYKLTYDNL
jgi:hypothetical protein